MALHLSFPPPPQIMEVAIVSVGLCCVENEVENPVSSGIVAVDDGRLVIKDSVERVCLATHHRHNDHKI